MFNLSNRLFILFIIFLFTSTEALHYHVEYNMYYILLSLLLQTAAVLSNRDMC